jgi:subtilisin family serine protease
VAFVEMVRAEDGRVTFAFKEPLSGRVRSTGVRAAVSRGTILAGHRLIQAAGAKILYPLNRIGAVIVQMDPEAAADVRDHPLIDYAEPRLWGRLQGLPGSASSLRAFSTAMAQAGEILPWGVAMVNAPAAWDSGGARGFGAQVLIIDSGHERGHEDLPLIPVWDCGGQYGGCDDAFPMPHGSHVMGILTARENGIGVVGVAPGLAAEFGVYAWGACNNHGGCDMQEATRGIINGIEAWNVDVINMSFGTEFPQSYPIEMANAVAAALAADIIVVAAAGNDLDNMPFWPAAQDGVIGVSGVRYPDGAFASTSPCPDNPRTGRPPWSNWGQHVDIAAPFYAMSTVPTSDYGDHTTPPYWCGTSMATPHVSAAAAILRGRYPDMGVYDVAYYLFQYAQDRGPSGWDDHYGHGILDVWNSLKHVQWPPPPPPGATATILGASEIQPYATCSWSVTTDLSHPPYTYAWWVDGLLQADEDEWFTYAAGPSDFSLTARVTNSLGQSVWDVHDVTVSPWALECTDW